MDLRCRDSRQHVAFFHFAERPRRSLHFRHHRGESTSFRLAKLDADISRRQFDFKHAPCSSLVSSSERRYRESVSLRLLPVSVFVDIFILEGDGGHACASSRPKDSSPPPRPDIRRRRRRDGDDAFFDAGVVGVAGRHEHPFSSSSSSSSRRSCIFYFYISRKCGQKRKGGMHSLPE